MSKESLFSNQHYTVGVAEVTDSSGRVSDGYKVTNVSTGVTEFESFNLPESIFFARDMSTHLVELFAESEVASVLHS